MNKRRRYKAKRRRAAWVEMMRVALTARRITRIALQLFDNELVEADRTYRVMMPLYLPPDLKVRVQS